MNDDQYFFCVVFVTSNICQRARIFVEIILCSPEGAPETPRVGCPSVMMLAGSAIKEER